mmetsp:Transcript_59823/g.141541  ORF Transcript_59823/g.141541 Transcript_59823/m.141541 type:complete len:295 (+) Transcript_59823:931-1815(+)
MRLYEVGPRRKHRLYLEHLCLSLVARLAVVERHQDRLDQRHGSFELAPVSVVRVRVLEQLLQQHTVSRVPLHGHDQKRLDVLSVALGKCLLPLHKHTELYIGPPQRRNRRPRFFKVGHVVLKHLKVRRIGLKHSPNSGIHSRRVQRRLELLPEPGVNVLCHPDVIKDLLHHAHLFLVQHALAQRRHKVVCDDLEIIDVGFFRGQYLAQDVHARARPFLGLVLFRLWGCGWLNVVGLLLPLGRRWGGRTTGLGARTPTLRTLHTPTLGFRGQAHRHGSGDDGRDNPTHLSSRRSG